MQIVIDIPESYYEGVILDRILETTLDGILEAIKNGKQLPKHGRLFDEDTIIKCMLNPEHPNYHDIISMIHSAPTILEANEG